MRAVRSKSYFRKALAVLCSCALAASLVVPCLAYASTEDASGNTPVSDTQIMDGIVAQSEQPTPVAGDVVGEAEEEGIVAQAEEADIAAQAETCTVTFGDKTITVEKGQTLAGLIPDVPDGSYTIPDGPAAGQTVTLNFYGWSTQKNGGTFRIYDDGTAVYSEEDFANNQEYIKEYLQVTDATVVNTDLTLYKIYTTSMERRWVRITGIIEGETAPWGYSYDKQDSFCLPDNFAVTESMLRPYINQFLQLAGEPGGLDPYCESQVAVQGAAWNYSWDGIWCNARSGNKKAQFPLITQDIGELNATVILTPEGEGPATDLPALTVNGNTGIKANGKLSGPNVPEGADIVVDTAVLTSGKVYDDLNAAAGASRIGDIFEITLMVNGREVHDGFGELSVSMPIDPGYNNHVIIVYHRHQDGSITTSRHVARDGYVTFTGTDLSTFAYADGGLAPEEAAAEGSKPPKTADNDALLGGCAILFCVSLAGLVALRTTRRREEA